MKSCHWNLSRFTRRHLRPLARTLLPTACVFLTGPSSSAERFDRDLGYVRALRSRLNQMGGSNYVPRQVSPQMLDIVGREFSPCTSQSAIYWRVHGRSRLYCPSITFPEAVGQRITLCTYSIHYNDFVVGFPRHCGSSDTRHRSSTGTTGSGIKLCEWRSLQGIHRVLCNRFRRV